MSSATFFSEQLSRLSAESLPLGGPLAPESAVREVVQNVEQGNEMQDADLCVLLRARPGPEVVEEGARLELEATAAL